MAEPHWSFHYFSLSLHACLSSNHVRTPVSPGKMLRGIVVTLAVMPLQETNETCTCRYLTELAQQLHAIADELPRQARNLIN